MRAERSLSASTRYAVLVGSEVEVRARFILPFVRFGYRVTGVASGAAALARIDTQRVPDVVVTDVVLPDFDGFELARRIRSLPEGGYPSVVAVSPEPITTESELDARRAGCDILLPRQTLPWSFVIRVDQLLRESRELRALSRMQIDRGTALSADAQRIRSRAQQVVERSKVVMARSALIPLAKEIIREFFREPGDMFSADQVASGLTIDVERCEQALRELVRLRLLVKVGEGIYRRSK